MQARYRTPRISSSRVRAKLRAFDGLLYKYDNILQTRDIVSEITFALNDKEPLFNASKLNVEASYA